SAQSSPRSASPTTCFMTKQAAQQPTCRGSILDADPPAYGVNIAGRMTRWLLERVADRRVIYVMGNHESYGTDIDRTLEKAKAAAGGSNVHVLQDEVAHIDNVTFVGATLWTDFALFGDAHRAMTVASDRMNDFRKIRTTRYMERFRPLHALARHRRSRAFIEAELRKERSGSSVVVTHHAPHPAQFLRPETNPLFEPNILTSSYRSDLTSLMSAEPDDGNEALQPAELWVYGHTHESFDVVIGETRVVSNAKRYGHGRTARGLRTILASIRTSRLRSSKQVFGETPARGPSPPKRHACIRPLFESHITNLALRAFCKPDRPSPRQQFRPTFVRHLSMAAPWFRAE
ncbi:MAG: metallophosphoesterase, partial [Xanthobacteraceae bacterium]